jgi:hypothetical protein
MEIKDERWKKEKKERVAHIKPGIHLEHASHQYRGEAEMIQTSS